MITVRANPSGEMWFHWVSEDVMLVAHTRKHPDATTWTGMCDSLAEVFSRSQRVRTLVFTDGGGPSKKQRDEMERVTKGKDYRVSVLTSAAGARFIVSTMSLLNPAISAFAPDDWQLGFNHLTTTRNEQQRIAEAFADLAKQPDGARFTTLSAVLRARSA